MKVRLVRVMDLILISISSSQYSMEGTPLKRFRKEKENEKKKIFNFGLYSDIYQPVSFKLDIIIESSKLYVLRSVRMIWTFS